MIILSVINQVTVKALLDTGTQVSAISGDLVIEIKKNNEIREFPVPTKIIKGALDKKTKVTHQIYLYMANKFPIS